MIGRSLWTVGIYELSVTEILWRLIDQGEIAIDVGANIGYMTSIMAKKVGQQGKVWCFEPQSDIYKQLSENIKNWQVSQNWNHIRSYRLALSNKIGEGTLVRPKNFINNRGTAYIKLSQGFVNKDEAIHADLVELSTLDKIADTPEKLGIMKIDVEGHELEVLEGAINLLKNYKIRDIIFEEHNNYPTQVTQFLEKYGYVIFRITKGLWKPWLKSPMRQITQQYWEPVNYLATLEPERAIYRLQKRGWNSLYNANL